MYEQKKVSDLSPDEAKKLTVFEIGSLPKAKALPQAAKPLPSPGICGYEVKKHESRYAKHDSVKLF